MTPNEILIRQKAVVSEFMEAMGQNPTVELQLSLMVEEGVELIEAGVQLSKDPTLDNMRAFLKEVADYFYVMVGAIVVSERVLEEGGSVDSGELSAKVSIIVDLTEQLMHDATSVFLDDDMITEAFDRIHASNLSKLGEDGKPIFNEEGKVMKGPNYVKPDLSDIAVVALERLLLAREEFEDEEDDFFGVAA